MTGRLDLNTGDGSIRASEVGGVMTLHTGDGSVHVDNGQGQIDVDTGDGSVEVSGNLTAVKLHTGDGSIVFRGDSRLVMSDDWDISTGDGSVDDVSAAGLRCRARRPHERWRHPQRAPGRLRRRKRRTTPAPGGTTPMRTAAVRSADESAEAESF